MTQPTETHSRVITCKGARATELRLLEEIDRVAAARVEDLALPVRIVVPSRSLRRHLLRVLARRRSAVAGVQVQTLFGLASEVVARAGGSTPREDAAFEVLLRRRASGVPVLRTNLEDLSDGYDAVVGAVRDLLDAGFLPGNEEGVIERLEEAAGEVAPERIGRSRSLVSLAAAVHEQAEEMGVRRSAAVLQAAEEELLAKGLELLSARALFVHGFADVTGLAADLLLALVRVIGGTVLLDRPPDPAEPDSDDLGGAYLSRLEQRMAHLDQEADASSDAPPEVELAEAPDAESEARWVGEKLREYLDRGIEPEALGVVGRGLESMVLPLRRQLRRLGVPFSGEGLSVRGAGPKQRLTRLAELLARGADAEVELWMETAREGARATEILLALRVLGIIRLGDLAGFTTAGLPPDGVRLPVAVGPEDESDRAEGSSRRLSRSVIERTIEEARALVETLARWPAAATAPSHRRYSVGVLVALGWAEGSSEYRAADDVFASLLGELPDAFEIEKAEWLKLVGDRLSRAGDVAIGGEGAGVQVLTVMESRARTFEHLLVVGVNRGVFPRVGNEDPMLPEAVRSRLAADVLPEMPVKGRSADEERYLFAQLMASAPSISLSWHVYGPDGTSTPSSFVDRIRLRDDVGEPARVRQVWSIAENDDRPRTAYEIAVLQAGRAGFEGHADLLEPAIAEGRGDAAVEAQVSAGELAAARAEALTAIERRPGETAPSPWFGLTGNATSLDDDPLWVTEAEKTGTCPWRAFVWRRLGVQPMPDPLLGLPAIGGPLVGSVVHGVLEAIVGEAVGRRTELGEALAAEGVPVPWPGRDRLEELLRREAHRVARREGLAPMGMAPLLEARARQFLEVERELEWSRGLFDGVLGSEVEGRVSISGLEGQLAFRADRVDSTDEGSVLTDYKAAKPAVTAKNDPFRRNNIARMIARGRLLQGSAYAHAGGDGSGTGRYVYLKPGDEWVDEVRTLAIEASDEELAGLFFEAVRVIAGARAVGVAFPRVEEADGKDAEHCKHCSVAEACRRQDSSFRRDLVRWMGEIGKPAGADEEAARSLWWLGVDRPEVEP